MSNVVTHPSAFGDPQALLRDLAERPGIEAVAVVRRNANGEFQCSWSSMKRSDLMALAAWLQFEAMHDTIKDQET